MAQYVPPAQEAATEYLKLGLDPIPLQPGTKIPLQSRWNTRPALDVQTVGKAFADENANLALRTGPQPNGKFLFGIDIDRGGNLASFCAGRPLPQTAEGLTPSGGRRLLFYSRKGLAVPTMASYGAIAPGIEIMGVDQSGNHSKIVVAPSVREDGKEYVWLWEPRQGIAVAPGWLIARIEQAHGKPLRALKKPRKGKAGQKPVPAARGQAKPTGTPGRGIRSGSVQALLTKAIASFVVDTAVSGSRNGQFFRMVCSLVCQGFDDATVQSVATLWWEHWFSAGACKTRPAPREVDAQVLSCRRAFASGRLKPGNSHWVGMLEQPVSDGQRATLCNPFINKEITKPAGRYATRPKLTAQEALFLEALLVVALYEKSKPVQTMNYPDHPHAFACTDRQLLFLLSARFDVDLAEGNNQLWRLKNKFMTRVKAGGEVIAPAKSEFAEELAVGTSPQFQKGAELKPSIFDPRGPLLAAIQYQEPGPATGAARPEAENATPAPEADQGAERDAEASRAPDGQDDYFERLKELVTSKVKTKTRTTKAKKPRQSNAVKTPVGQPEVPRPVTPAQSGPWTTDARDRGAVQEPAYLWAEFPDEDGERAVSIFLREETRAERLAALATLEEG